MLLMLAAATVCAIGSLRAQGPAPAEETPPRDNPAGGKEDASRPTAPPSDDARSTRTTSASEADEAIVLGDVAEVLVQAALDGEAHRMLAELCEVAPARLSGSPAAARAVEWGLETMRSLGLENVRAEPVMVPRWVRGEPETCQMLDENGWPIGALPILALGGSIATPENGIEAEVMVVRSFGELRERADEAKGKIVLFDRPMRRGLLNTFRAYGEAVPQRTSGAVEAAKAGAVFALVRSMTTRRDDAPHTGMMRYADDVPRIPTAAISVLGAEQIAAAVEDGKRVRLRIEMSCETLPDVESANVVGELRGRDLPDEIVVIGGHLDSWDVGHGAHDDGAGCVHALEAVRLLREQDLVPRRTVRVVLFMNEENGLRGGLGYEERHIEELDRHVAAIETDTGGFAPVAFSCSAEGEAFERLARRIDVLDPIGAGALIPGGGGADIGPLGKHGVTLLGLRTLDHRYFDLHHSVNDTIDAVNERELGLGAAALAYATWCIAEFGI
jgi:carboxypeptidase Q